MIAFLRVAPASRKPYRLSLFLSYSLHLAVSIIYTPHTSSYIHILAKQFEIKYRTANGMLVPYIDIAVKSNIKEVKVSPFLKKTASAKTLKEYLDKCGFGYASVTQSDLPVR